MATAADGRIWSMNWEDGGPLVTVVFAAIWWFVARCGPSGPGLGGASGHCVSRDGRLVATHAASSIAAAHDRPSCRRPSRNRCPNRSAEVRRPSRPRFLLAVVGFTTCPATKKGSPSDVGGWAHGVGAAMRGAISRRQRQSADGQQDDGEVAKCPSTPPMTLMTAAGQYDRWLAGPKAFAAQWSGRFGLPGFEGGPFSVTVASPAAEDGRRRRPPQGRP